MVTLTLRSNLPDPVHCDHMAISIVYESPLLEHTDPVTERRRRNKSGQSLKRHRRYSSCSSTQGIEFYNHVTESASLTSQKLDLGAQIERKQDNKTITSCGLLCKTPLKRIDSGTKGFKEKEVVKEDFEMAFVAGDLEIVPGENNIELSGKVSCV